MLSATQILLLEQLPGIGKAAILAINNHLVSNKLNLPYREAEILDFLEEVRKDYKRLRLPTLDNLSMAIAASELVIEQSDRHGIKTLSFNDPTFPRLLATIKDMPLLLHCKGNIASLQAPTVAIIGTREPSAHALAAGPKLSSYFVDAGFTVVSGLAAGCDTIGHRASVDAKKPTVAVMAGGLHSVYPSENKELANRILGCEGLLLSELPFGKDPYRSTFVDRDRLQSGLSRGVVVLETGVKGGTLHTVGFALKESRPVACMYSHMKSKGGFETHDKFQGNRMLVEESKAVPLDSPAAIQGYIEKLLSQGRDSGNPSDPELGSTSSNAQFTLFS